uniref:Bromo domain-containing protein n=1 Tax=Chlamydomonas leiostraca TaxID=1034604 RepID=A0A7S0RX62_9CHLO|mmetsp:Transcript_32529/g.82637  ORF Transcript_32529/g.82637 Transcript_32529/m.82637 type:complete len:241 (+) Transcript_32529:259-981(+)|eukprot:CAMPEP_0202867784 /NCGR_PEP_ID=MMETSP1391-20130828/9619_1 /ASSEMBLY_ACC=CAM_ASM_000867 /TAXON_ID=1034604 /ORGANISM="Chlamydomonas leiostraca, Strain SAG 11-49" /LENGTH=240 /DNA_ID=CAMNT_0049547849 /DNA_START=259 /DNA_END=981 /DNA_ORIENTATION=+
MASLASSPCYHASSKLTADALDLAGQTNLVAKAVPATQAPSAGTLGPSLESCEANNQGLPDAAAGPEWGRVTHEADSAQPEPAPAFRSRREARAVLAGLFAHYVDKVLEVQEYWPFKNKVSKRVAPDYHDFVAPDDEVWLGLIKRRALDGEYESRDAFWADVVQLHINCEEYNKYGRGAACSPWLTDVSDTLIGHVARLMDGDAEDIEGAERFLALPPPAQAKKPSSAKGTKRVRFEEGW